VRDDVVEPVVEQMRATSIGAAVDCPDMGPLITEHQRSNVLSAIAGATAGGARLRTGGTDAPETAAGGFYVEPTVFDEVDPGSSLAQEEVFGPVLAVMDFDSEQKALEIANGTRFGLMAGVWTRDLGRAHRVARELRCGQVYVNTYGAGTGIELPFGGYKKSGIGREKGIAGYLEYTQIKNVCIKVDST
jgi:aldehyde dehydrogenase (NAD+)